MSRVFIVTIGFTMLLLLYTAPVIHKNTLLSTGKEIKVLLAYHPVYLKDVPQILDAYESVLQEEGVPYENIDVFQLTSLNVDDLVERIPVVILPDHLLQNVPQQFGYWIQEYLAKGGNVAVIYDVGIRHKKGYFLDRAVFSDIVGLNYITFNTRGGAAFDCGQMVFSSEASRDFFQIPFGKTIDRVTFSGYGYGALKYPMSRNEPVRYIPESAVYAYSVTAQDEKFPLIVLTDYAKGKVLYVNMPLGHLKANADDLPLRSALRTFLFDVVGIPHVMNVENGQGGIVINWHVDSDIEHITLPAMRDMGLLRKGVNASFHITAGEFRDYPGDGQGFAAGGTGKNLVKMLQGYGVIGSHGGWAHNWFAKNIEDGVWEKKEVKEYIDKNNTCLEQIVGYKITEYSAPCGVHPQFVTNMFEDMGVVAYYYAGDSGSAPNRTFYEGKMTSNKAIAFPVMPFGRTASLWEMHELGKKKDSEVTEWFFSILDFAARNRTVRMLYSHPYDIKEYPRVVTAFLDQVEQMQNRKEIMVRPMSEFANFFLRFLKTTYSFNMGEKQLVISLKNPEHLNGVSVAIPKKKYKKPLNEDLLVHEDERYYYLTVRGLNEKEKNITVDFQ